MIAVPGKCEPLSMGRDPTRNPASEILIADWWCEYLSCNYEE